MSCSIKNVSNLFVIFKILKVFQLNFKNLVAFFLLRNYLFSRALKHLMSPAPQLYTKQLPMGIWKF